MKTPRFFRCMILATCGVTLIWLAGCGGATSSPDEPAKPRVSRADLLEQQNAQFAAEKEAAAKAATNAAREAFLNEAPRLVTRDDFERGSKLRGGGEVSSAIKGVLQAAEDVQLMNLKHNLTIHGEDRGYPESHEAFMKLIDGWGIKLPPLDGPYDYQYNPEDHELYKVPSIEKYDAIEQADAGSGSK